MSLTEKTGVSCRSLFFTILCFCGLFMWTIKTGQQSPINKLDVEETSSYVRHPPGYEINFYDTGSFHLTKSAPWNFSSDTTEMPNLSSHVITSDPQVHQPLGYIQKGMVVTASTAKPLSSSVRDIQPTTSPKCAPIQRIVFVKTHKTASTTIASVFERYGYSRNLTFAVGRNHVLSFQYKFSRKNVMGFPKMKGKPFDILTNHARYNKKEMKAVVPNASYITILRNPEDQIASAFGYFEMYRGMNIGKEANPLKTFMDDPMKYYKDHKYHMWQLSRNGMLFDLGFEHKYEENQNKIKDMIEGLDADFDLVMITEYIDESLLLMRKMLCWEYRDIVYLSCGIRSKSHRYEKNDKLRDKLRQWSHGDMMLYTHFNKTLWKKIADYGPSFQMDLKYFRDLNKSVYDECVDPSKMNHVDRREDMLILKKNSEWCKSVIWADMYYTQIIRKYMVKRFGAPPK